MSEDKNVNKDSKLNPSGIVCCIMCGRDTRSKSGICYKCVTGHVHVKKFGDMSGRKCRNNEMLDQDEEPEEDTSETRYHGDNWTDG